MSASRLTRLRLIHVQLRRNGERHEFEEKVDQHLLACDAVKGAIVAGEEERMALAESLERLRLSKVVEALRRVNSKDDFNEALDDLIRRLRELSGVVDSVDGITMRNMLPLDVDAFLDELREMNEAWHSYNEAPIEIVSLRQKLEEVGEKVRAVDKNLRSLVMQDIIVTALCKNPDDGMPPSCQRHL